MRRRRTGAVMAIVVGLICLAGASLAVADPEVAPADTEPGALVVDLDAPSAMPNGDLLDRPQRGLEALRRLGDRLPEVAARNGWSTATLNQELRRDSRLWVDERGLLFYVEEEQPSHTAGETANGPVEAAVEAGLPGDSVLTDHPLSATFSLHSLPGADRVIYLDFDGHDASGTAWDRPDDDVPAVAQPYNTSGSPDTFSDSERRIIQDVWRRVAEDFAPFAVDVTTEDPGIGAIRRTDQADQRYGTRVVITPTYTYACSCGGVAYLRAFNAYGTTADGGARHDLTQPAWVFIAGTNAKSIAEAASHEAGHNLALAHDGDDQGSYYRGHGDWAPIMGVGYSRGITQWSRGEYAAATNTEDDLAIIQASGAPARADDHGDPSNPVDLPTVDVDISGVIGLGGDRDAFRFATTGGRLDVSAVATLGPNLDIGLRVLDSSGAPVAEADPPGVNAGVITDLAAGTYLLEVRGVGAGNPLIDGYSSYGSLGHYRLRGTLPPRDGGDPNRAPTAVIQAAPTSGDAPIEVSFDGRGSSDPDGDSLSYRWTFGDGTTATGPTATHRYDRSGTYQAGLEVSDGGLTASASIMISVGDGGEDGGDPPSPPSNVVVTLSQDRGVTITWRDNADDETGYRVVEEALSRRGSVRRSTELSNLGADSRSYSYRPSPGTYQYVIVATNDVGDSDPARSGVVVVSKSKRGNQR